MGRVAVAIGLLALMVLVPSPLGRGTLLIWVAPSSDRRGACEAESPCGLRWALEQVEPGETVSLLRGTYR